MDDAGFLDAIRLAPDDPALRLIYADWLDERGDERAPLIRAEEEMRTLAPFSDAYWHLKPGRDRLKADAPAGWLDALGYNLPWPVFSHGWPDDWKGRWRVLRAFAANWCGAKALDDVTQVPAVLRLRESVGRAIPPSLMEYFALDWTSVGPGEQHPQIPTDWLVQPGPDAIVMESHDLGLFGVAFDLFGCDDPPVTWYRETCGIYEPYQRGTEMPQSLRSVSEYAKARLLESAPANTSEFAVTTPDPEFLALARRDFGEAGFAELPGLYYSFWAGRDRSSPDAQGFGAFNLVVSNSMPDRVLPTWLWDYCRRLPLQASEFTGRFADAYNQNGPYPEPSLPDDIPF